MRQMLSMELEMHAHTHQHFLQREGKTVRAREGEGSACVRAREREFACVLVDVQLNNILGRLESCAQSPVSPTFGPFLPASVVETA